MVAAPETMPSTTRVYSRQEFGRFQGRIENSLRKRVTELGIAHQTGKEKKQTRQLQSDLFLVKGATATSRPVRATFKYAFTREHLTLGIAGIPVCDECKSDVHPTAACPKLAIPDVSVELKRDIPDYEIEDWSRQISSFYHSTRITQDKMQKLGESRRMIEHILKKKMLLRTDSTRLLSQEQIESCRVEMFGSVLNGFGTCSSDLDICVRFSTNSSPISSDVEKLILSDMSNSLFHSHNFASVQKILTAKVPIVKFRTNEGIDGDLSLYNELALVNTRLLAEYNKWSGDRLAELVLWLKQWAKVNQLGDASAGSLSSYSWVVLIISFLQQKNLLPYLQEYPADSDRPRYPVSGWDTYFYEGAVDRNMKSRLMEIPLARLLFDFFAFYVTFKFDVFVVQIRRSRMLTLLEKNKWARSINIEDPFDLEHNLTSGVTRRTFIHFRQRLANACKLMWSGELRRVFCDQFGFDKDQALPAETDYALATFTFKEFECDYNAVPNQMRCFGCGGRHLMRQCPKGSNSTRPEKSAPPETQRIVAAVDAMRITQGQGTSSDQQSFASVGSNGNAPGTRPSGTRGRGGPRFVFGGNRSNPRNAPLSAPSTSSSNCAVTNTSIAPPFTEGRCAQRTQTSANAVSQHATASIGTQPSAPTTSPRQLTGRGGYRCVAVRDMMPHVNAFEEE